MFSKGGRVTTFRKKVSWIALRPDLRYRKILTFENFFVFWNHDVCLRNSDATLFSEEVKSFEKVQCEPSPAGCISRDASMALG
jgi:hypothetical protein